MLKSALFLATVLAVPAAAQDADSPTHPDRARVEVHKGRCVLLAEGQTERTIRSGNSGTTDGRTHVEVAAGSEVRFSWPGRASLYVWGPAAFQWSTTEVPSGEAPTATFSDQQLTWEFFDVAWCDVEVRRGEHRLRLPGDWRLDVDSGAVHLRGLPQGPVEVRHHAGSPLSLVWEGDSANPRPPVTVYSGSSVRVDMPAPSPEDRSSMAPAWGQSQWPWRERADTDEEVRERVAQEGRTNQPGGWPTADRPVQVDRARVPEFTERTGVRVDVEPEPMVVDEDPSQRETPMSPFTGAPAVQKPTETEPEVPSSLMEAETDPEPEVPAKPAFVREDWGGLRRDQLEPAGVLAVERSEHVEVRMFSSGRRKVFVDSSCTESIRCFGPMGDFVLEPGTVAVFEKDGSMKSAFGDYERTDAPADRPAFRDLD